MVVKDATSGSVLAEFHSSHYGHDSGQVVHEVVVEGNEEEMKEEALPEGEVEEEEQAMFVEEPSGVKEAGAGQWVRTNSVSGLYLTVPARIGTENSNFPQEVAEVQEVQLVSEEGVGAEDTAVLIQEAVEYQCDGNVDGGQKAQTLEDTVGSMKEAVSLTQVAVKQGTTLKGSQQVGLLPMIRCSFNSVEQPNVPQIECAASPRL